MTKPVMYLPAAKQDKVKRKFYLAMRNMCYRLTGYSSFDIYTSASHIKYGVGVALGPGVKIISKNHDLYNIWKHDNYEDVVIGNYCWIGANAVILPGVILGDHTIVGAGAIVTKPFPNGYCVIVGNPARVVKKLDKRKCEEKL